MVDGPTGKIVFLSCILIAFAIFVMEGVLTVLHDVVPSQFTTAAVGLIGLAAGAAGINPMTVVMPARRRSDPPTEDHSLERTIVLPGAVHVEGAAGEAVGKPPSSGGSA